MEYRWAPLVLGLLSIACFAQAHFEWKDHPIIKEVEDAIHESNERLKNGELNGPDPNAYWMKQFLPLMAEHLPDTAVTFDQLLPNLQRLAEYDHKGYLKPIANMEMSQDELTWPDPHLKPYIISAYMPVQTDDDPEPVIKLEQTYKGQKIYKEILGPNAKRRRRRDIAEGESEHMTRALHINPDAFNKDIPYLDGHFADHDVHEVELDEHTGEEKSRRKRALPESMVVFPPKDTKFYAAVIHVAAHANKTIIMPDPET